MPNMIDWKVIEELATCTDTHSGYPSVRLLVALAAFAPCEKPVYVQAEAMSPSVYDIKDCGTCDPCCAAALNKKLEGNE